MNATCRTWISEFLNRGGLVRLAQRLGGARVAIFALHRVLPASELFDSYNPHIVIEERCFEQLVNWLLKEWEVVPLSHIIQGTGRSKNRNCCALTFDDGWEDNYRIAFPILRSNGIPATIFLPTRYVGSMEFLPEERLASLIRLCREQNCENEFVKEFCRLALSSKKRVAVSDLPRQMKRLSFATKLGVLQELEHRFGREPDQRHHLDWPQIAEMEKAGITFGSHTVNHALLTRETDQTIRTELYASKQILCDRLQSPLNVLAYPNGDFDSRVVNIAAELGYEAAVTTEVGIVEDSTHRYRLPRIPIDSFVVGDQRGKFSVARARVHVLRAPVVRHEC